MGCNLSDHVVHEALICACVVLNRVGYLIFRSSHINAHVRVEGFLYSDSWFGCSMLLLLLLSLLLTVLEVAFFS